MCIRDRHDEGRHAQRGNAPHNAAAGLHVGQTDADDTAPVSYTHLDVYKRQVQFLSESAFADACRPGNPRDTSVEEIATLYRKLL